MKPGDKMSEGSVYAGLSDTGGPMYTTPADAPLTMTFNDAAAYAEKLNAKKYLGHDAWRVPTIGELNVMFNNRAAIGGFKTSAPSGWYWSSHPHYKRYAWDLRVSNDGYEGKGKDLHSSVRLVRSGP